MLIILDKFEVFSLIRRLKFPLPFSRDFPEKILSSACSKHLDRARNTQFFNWTGNWNAGFFLIRTRDEQVQSPFFWVDFKSFKSNPIKLPIHFYFGNRHSIKSIGKRQEASWSVSCCRMANVYSPFPRVLTYPDRLGVSFIKVRDLPARGRSASLRMIQVESKSKSCSSKNSVAYSFQFQINGFNHTVFYPHEVETLYQRDFPRKHPP